VAELPNALVHCPSVDALEESVNMLPLARFKLGQRRDADAPAESRGRLLEPVKRATASPAGARVQRGVGARRQAAPLLVPDRRVARRGPRLVHHKLGALLEERVA